MWTEWRAAVLRHLPPTEDLLEAGQYAIAPAAGAALVAFAALMLVFGKRAALPGAALGMVAGFAAANHFREVFPWWPGGAGWHWVPLLFLLALADGLLARSGTPGWGRWRLRLGVGLLAAFVLVPIELHHRWPLVLPDWPFPFRARFWPLAAFTLTVVLGWAGSEAVARQAPGGTVGLGLSAALFGASFVMLHAHSAVLTEALTFGGAALLGVSLVAVVAKVDVGGAIPGIAVLLPSILLVGLHETFNDIPWHAFLLAGLPPVAVGLLAVPPFSRWTGLGRSVLFWLLCLGPTAAAVVLALRA